MSEVRTLGRYVIVDEIGRGAMGIVYKAVHPSFGIPVALKVLNEDRAHDGKLRERLRREARVMASLDHPGVARIYDFDADGDQLFLVMEFIDGRTLRSLLLQHGRLEVAAAAKLVLAVLDAVGAAHRRGVVHRDMKPDNVMVTSAGKVKVVDFGVSKMLGDGRVTASGITLGTPTYMAPEQLRGEELDGRTDIYALGVMLYEVLAGHPPFMGGTAQVMRAQIEEPPPPAEVIPPELMQVVARAMAKERRDRYQSFVEFALALTRAADIVLAAKAPAATVEVPALTPRRSASGGVRRALAGRLPGAALLAGVTATMVALTSLVAVVTFAPSSPSTALLAAVDAYLDGLATGNPAQAWSAIRIDDSAIPPGVPRALGSDQLAAMLQLPANQQPQPDGISLRSVTDAAGATVVDVRYVASGATHDVMLRLAASGAGWRVLVQPGALALPPLPAGRLLLDGLPVATAPGEPIAVLPGVHDLSFQPAGPFAPSAAEVTVRDPWPAAVAVPLRLAVSDAALTAVRASVRAAFAACAVISCATSSGRSGPDCARRRRPSARPRKPRT